jgi:hypothetical protein
MAPPSVFCATAWCDGVANTDATKAAIAKFRIIDVILPVAITLLIAPASRQVNGDVTMPRIGSGLS